MVLLAVALFAAGSAISGAAINLQMLVAGRAVMGTGGGGILVMLEIIICDLCPQRDRPKYLGIAMGVFGIAMCLGPLIGGALAEHASWRWIFYINLPVSAVSFVALAGFLRVNYNKDSVRNMLWRVDWAGNALFAASVTSILLALSWGGTEYAWSSPRTLVPLILGMVGFVAFLGIESTNLIPQPTMPLRLFTNRTSLGAFGLTFIASILTYWTSYWLPVYFQAVKGATPTSSGVDVLPFAVVMIPFSILAGGGISALGRFGPFQIAGISFMTISMGLFSLLGATTSKGMWAGFQIIAAAGAGLLLQSTLPAVQAPLPEADVAIATATWGFLRSLGGIWGVAIPSAIFNSHVNSLLYRIDDPLLRDALRDGGAYARAASGLRNLVPDNSTELLAEVKQIYIDSLRLCWQVGIGFGLLGFIVAVLIKHVDLREELDTDFGLVNEKPNSQSHESNQDKGLRTTQEGA